LFNVSQLKLWASNRYYRIFFTPFSITHVIVIFLIVFLLSRKIFCSYIIIKCFTLTIIHLHNYTFKLNILQNDVICLEPGTTSIDCDFEKTFKHRYENLLYAILIRKFNFIDWYCSTRNRMYIVDEFS